MDINVTDIGYDVEMISEDGTVYLLNDALLSLTWEEQENTLAQRATLSVANLEIGKTWLMAIAKINCIIRIYGKWGAGRQMLFEGTIWDWQYTSASQRELTISAYDPLIRLQQSKDFKYFSAGLDTTSIIGNICADWGVTLDYKWAQKITHEKKVFSGNSISDMIIELLSEVYTRTGNKYVCFFRDGKMQVIGYGNNKPIYKFTKDNTISTIDKLSINDLVTRVKIIGKADDDGRSAVDAVIDGDLKYGVLQEIIRRDSDKDVGAAKAEAAATLKERGRPKETIMVTAPDLPFLRRGDVVDMAAGNLLGFFSVLGVSHNATQKQMTMTLETFNPPTNTNTAAATAELPKEPKDWAQGDAVILNGPVYVDSYGNGKGRTFTDYHSTITIVAPLNRACPYHIGQIGWVYPNEITRG